MQPRGQPAIARRSVRFTDGMPLDTAPDANDEEQQSAELQQQVDDLQMQIYKTQMSEFHGICFACNKPGHRQYEKDEKGEFVCPVIQYVDNTLLGKILVEACTKPRKNNTGRETTRRCFEGRRRLTKAYQPLGGSKGRFETLRELR